MDNKMRNIIFNILIISYLLLIISTDVSPELYIPCPLESYNVGNLKFENDTLPPVNLTVINNGTNQITAIFQKNRTNDFNLILFGNPFVKDGSKCPSLNTTDPNLRKWHRKCNIIKEANFTHIQYASIFDGCFYFVISNLEEDKHWVHGPKFYNTSYKYLDTRVMLTDRIFKPEVKERSSSLIMHLKLQLDCIPVRLKLYEYKINHTNAMINIKNGALKENQSCWISIIDGKSHKNCMLISPIQLEMEVTKEDDTWIIQLEWKNLIRGGANYHFDYSNHDLDKCVKQYGYSNLYNWNLVNANNYVDFGKWYGSNEPVEKKSDEKFPWPLTISCIVSFIIIIIIIYGIRKWCGLRDMIDDKDKRPGMMEDPILVTFDETESDKILLIYVEDSEIFKKRLNALKIFLENHCNGYKIKDVYARNEWSDIAAVGVTKWIEQQLKSGSKVVWFDTPKFRSRLTDKKKVHTWDDCRDEAAPHAVDVARTLFQNAKTQYRRHFVVRLKEFNVDDQQEDPLQMFTPYTRYYIPDHLSLLCEHLKGPMERLKRKENFYTVLKLDSSLNNQTTYHKV